MSRRFLLFVQERTQEPSKTAHEFQVLVAKAAETLMEKVGVNKEVELLFYRKVQQCKCVSVSAGTQRVMGCFDFNY